MGLVRPMHLNNVLYTSFLKGVYHEISISLLLSWLEPIWSSDKYSLTIVLHFVSISKMLTLGCSPSILKISSSSFGTSMVSSNLCWPFFLSG